MYTTEQGIEILLDSENEQSFSIPQSLPKIPLLFSTKLQKREETDIFLNLVQDKFSSSSTWFPLSAAEKLSAKEQAVICESLGKLWPLFRANKLNQSLSYSHQWLPKEADFTEGVCFYGGSFNPWHQGHEECLRLCPEKNIIIILDTNPLKNLRGEEEFFLEYKKIKEKIDRLAADINKHLFVYPGFFGSSIGNPTVSWLPSLPMKQKNLLIGDDNFMSIEKWKDYKLLLESLRTLYVVPRLSTQEELDDKKNDLDGLFADLSIKILPHHKYQGLSSSKIRSQVKDIDG